MKNEIGRVTARTAPVLGPRRLATFAAIALIGAIVAPGLLAQSVGAPGKPLAFEVASVKLHTSDDQQVMMVAQPGGRFTARNIPLQFLIRTAYQLQDDQISGGPNWITTDRFDILAKADEGAPTTQLPSMLQTLLVDRFKLTAHREMRDLPIYALMLARAFFIAP